jgi:histidinol-phosphate/aromatic aminotransferase/cobyric acid decarboxylase-like protein
MPFPLGEWIDSHESCRHNLAKSGMRGAIPTPVPTPGDIRRANEAELTDRLAADLRVEPSRVFLTTGASQANALTLLFLGRRRFRGPSGACRVLYPEYPPLFDTARWAGFRLTEALGPVEVAVVSQPRNPEGDLWDRGRLWEWGSGARWMLVDETFREFAETPSLLGADRPNLWTTGSFTKYYAGDDLRVGFVVAPPQCSSEFGRFWGLVRNPLPPYSIAGATRALQERKAIRRKVRTILDVNRNALRARIPSLPTPVAPVVFDRLPTGENGDRLARRAVDASVLVCSGSFFGDPTGVRLCLTQRTFPTDLDAYLAVRDRSPGGHDRPRGSGATVKGRAARRPPAGTGRA